MSHPLDGPRLKVRRAEREIQRLRLAEEAFGRDAGYQAIPKEINPQNGYRVYRLSKGKAPCPEWGVWVGEITHNLCSALDGLFYQLLILASETPTPTDAFPIFYISPKPGEGRSSAMARAKKAVLAKIKRLRPEHQTIVEGLQPYNRGASGESDPLWMLRQVNIVDKHRMLIVMHGIHVDLWHGEWSADNTFSKGWTAPFSILEDGAKIGEFPDCVTVKPNLTPAVAFGNGVAEVQGRRVCLILSTLAEHTSEIIECFALDFT